MKIILVDDNPHVRDSLRQMLTRLQIRIDAVWEAVCDSSAVQLIEMLEPDLIVTDAKLLLLNGSRLLDRLEQRLPQSKVVVTSSHDFILAPFALCGIDSLQKPLNSASLEPILSRLSAPAST
ncbi:response regulator [Paenibacillus sp. NFR01]|uniref:response regulator n=1 Tax=Paenibacillus sp. NFR01 TaxID=1566279 RepID=UPI0008C257B7|nr:response regulator [Paenibacillus sp. NFR01]SET90717.1 two-component system, LytT family, response regulator [Paenibacillus sp. NFR01]